MPVVIVIGGVAIDVVTALAILIAAYAAAIMLVKPLAWLLGNIPWIGSQIADAMNKGVNAFESWAQDNAKNAIGALSNVISAAVYWISNVFQASVKVAEYIVAQVVASVNAIAKLAKSTSLGFSNAASSIVDIYNQLANIIGSIPEIARTVAKLAVTALENTVRTWVGEINKAIAQAIDTAHVELGHAIDGVQTAIGDLDRALRHAIGTAVDGVHTWVNDRLRPIESDLSGVKGIVDALPTVATIVGTITAVQTIEKIVEDCVKPTCSGLGPSLDILNAIADGAALAEMLALVALAAHDPEGAAKEVTGVVNSVEGIVRTILEPAGIAA